MNKDPYLLSSYQFDLPQELIAQTPCNPRDSSRLMVIDRQSGNIHEMVFRDLVDFLHKGDSLVFNDTRVIPARLLGKRKGGGDSEIFLVAKRSSDTWEVLARPGKKLGIGATVSFGLDFSCEIIEILDNGNRLAKFLCEGDFDTLLEKYGQIPLPHYIRREAVDEGDKERYQTVFASNPGAVAAPTAGLHFTSEMLHQLQTKQVEQTHITLHIGLGTFRPVQVEDIRQHAMHSEHVIITPQAAEKLNSRPKNGRQICVGTTCCRSLESMVTLDGSIRSGESDTQIFIYPGCQFRYVQHLLTNFHLPGSSLIMLVSAFAGYELVMEAYDKAVKERYRFFSYGDAMLII